MAPRQAKHRRAPNAETPGGPFPFSPCPRARSESSFSEIVYDNTPAPAAGVSSKQSHRHKAKSCTEMGVADRQGDPEMLDMDEAKKVNPYKMKYSKSRIDGRRMDPAAMSIPAGAPRHMCVLMQCADDGPEVITEEGKKVEGERLGIEMVPHKKLFDPCKRDIVRHIDDHPEPSRTCVRLGYESAALRSTFTVNECAENGFSPKVPLRTSRSSTENKNADRVYTSCKGERQYTICGIEDLRAPSTRSFIKSDVPPTARHVHENNRTDLMPFEYAQLGPSINPMKDSSAMWGCLNWTTRRRYEPPEVVYSVPPSCKNSTLGSDYADYLGTSRPDDLPLPSGGSVASSGKEQRPRMKKSSSVPSVSRASRTSTATGGSVGSRASSVSNLSRSRPQRQGTPAACRSPSNGSGSPARLEWRY